MEASEGARLTVTTYDGERVRQGGAELLDAPAKKWIDLVHPDEPTMKVLAQRYGLHRLAVEDCLHLDQRPKLEEYPGHHFLVLQAFRFPEGRPHELEMTEMHFIFGEEWLITVHVAASPAVEAARRRIEEDPKGTFGRGTDFVAYLVADALVDQNFPLLDAFADELEDLEALIFGGPKQRHLQRAFALKRDLVFVRRVLSPQRDVIALLAKRASPVVGERTALYFRDVYDHLLRLYEQIEATRDQLSNVMEAYLSVVANKTNEITKQLTIFATIFLPLSFITGFFGQNFDVLGQSTFFVLMLGLISALPLGMLFWFWRRGWI